MQLIKSRDLKTLDFHRKIKHHTVLGSDQRPTTENHPTPQPQSMKQTKSKMQNLVDKKSQYSEVVNEISCHHDNPRRVHYELGGTGGKALTSSVEGPYSIANMPLLDYDSQYEVELMNSD